MSSDKDQNKEVINYKDAGFSLVELIIVIAIMAVLIGVVGTQVVPYMNNAKRAKDLQILSAYVTAGVSAYTKYPESVSTDSPFVITIVAGTDGDEYNCTDGEDIAEELEYLISHDNVTEAQKVFNSREFKKMESIVVTFDFENKRVTVEALDENNANLNDANEVMGVL